MGHWGASPNLYEHDSMLGQMHVVHIYLVLTQDGELIREQITGLRRLRQVADTATGRPEAISKGLGLREETGSLVPQGSVNLYV